MRRLFPSLVAAAIAVTVAPAFADAQPEGSANLDQEGFPGEPHASACTDKSSDEDCLEYWETHINWWSFDYKPGPGQAREHRHMPAPFGFALINFAVFLAIMSRLAWKPLVEFVQERHHTIKRDLDEAARLRRAAEAKLDEYQGRIARMDAEIDELVGGIRKDAELEKARIVAAAEAEAARLKKDAEAQIATELTRARRELRKEVVDAAVAAATELLAQKTSPDDQRRLVDRYLVSLEAPSARPASGKPA